MTIKDINSNLQTVQSIEGSLMKSKRLQGSLHSISQPLISLQGDLKHSIQGTITIKPFIIGKLQKNKEIQGALFSFSSVQGNMLIPQKQANPQYDFYMSVTEVTPSFFKQVLETKNKIVTKNIKINQIPVYETSNSFGTTFII